MWSRKDVQENLNFIKNKKGKEGRKQTDRKRKGQKVGKGGREKERVWGAMMYISAPSRESKAHMWPSLGAQPGDSSFLTGSSTEITGF